jgi:hypothetical protein
MAAVSTLSNSFAPQRRHLLIVVGIALAAAAPFAAPSSVVLPGPDGIAEKTLAFLALLGAFAAGYVRPRPALYALVTVALLEGAFRKWVLNDIVVFLFKDFLAIGLYAGAARTMEWRDFKRPTAIVLPLFGLLALSLVYMLRSPSLSAGLIGLRAYAIYVPLLWVAPKLLDTPRRLGAFLGVVLAAGVVESVLATVQTLTADAWLNEMVAGVRPAYLLVDGIGFLRPTGTMLQVGTFAAFLLFPVLVAFGLIMRHTSGRWLHVGIASLPVLSWGVIYTGSRALFATAVASGIALLLYLAWRRRFWTLLAVPAAVAAGFLAISYQPFIGGPVRGGNDSHFLRTDTVTWIDHDGTIRTEKITVGRGDPRATGGFVGRASGREGPGTDASDKPVGRIGAQLDLLFDQRLAGHGTGTMSLGSQYLLQERDEAGESHYVKVAYELGWPGLILFVWFAAALWVAAAWSSFIAPSWRGPAAAVALGAATFVPVLTLLTYAFDYPIVSMLFYSLTGCAVAWASQRPTRGAAGRPG